jgi:hypothetical protein
MIPRMQEKFKSHGLNVPVEIYQSVLWSNNPDQP